MREDNRKALEDIVSPSDVPLIDLIGTNIDAIKIATEIFSDRNCTGVLASLIIGTIQTVISTLCGVHVDAQKLKDFIVNEEMENKNND